MTSPKKSNLYSAKHNFIAKNFFFGFEKKKHSSLNTKEDVDDLGSISPTVYEHICAYILALK
jgi:hypothetical protein